MRSVTTILLIMVFATIVSADTIPSCSFGNQSGSCSIGEDDQGINIDSATVTLTGSGGAYDLYATINISGADQGIAKVDFDFTLPSDTGDWKLFGVPGGVWGPPNSDPLLGTGGD